MVVTAAQSSCPGCNTTVTTCFTANGIPNLTSWADNSANKILTSFFLLSQTNFYQFSQGEKFPIIFYFVKLHFLTNYIFIFQMLFISTYVLYSKYLEVS